MRVDYVVRSGNFGSTSGAQCAQQEIRSQWNSRFSKKTRTKIQVSHQSEISALPLVSSRTARRGNLQAITNHGKKHNFYVVRQIAYVHGARRERSTIRGRDTIGVYNLTNKTLSQTLRSLTKTLSTKGMHKLKNNYKRTAKTLCPRFFTRTKPHAASTIYSLHTRHQNSSLHLRTALETVCAIYIAQRGIRWAIKMSRKQEQNPQAYGPHARVRNPRSLCFCPLDSMRACLVFHWTQETWAGPFFTLTSALF